LKRPRHGRAARLLHDPPTKATITARRNATLASSSFRSIPAPHSLLGPAPRTLPVVVLRTGSSSRSTRTVRARRELGPRARCLGFL
jgi:hypothetical protein